MTRRRRRLVRHHRRLLLRLCRPPRHAPSRVPRSSLFTPFGALAPASEPALLAPSSQPLSTTTTTIFCERGGRVVGGRRGRRWRVFAFTAESDRDGNGRRTSSPPPLSPQDDGRDYSVVVVQEGGGGGGGGTELVPREEAGPIRTRHVGSRAERLLEQHDRAGHSGASVVVPHPS